MPGLSEAARSLVARGELVAGGARHLALAAPLIGAAAERLAWPSPLEAAFETLARWRGRRVVVLASGDPFNYGIGKQLAERFPAGEMVCLPQPSAFSLAAARMGWSLPDTALVTLHGRSIESIVRHLYPGARILALSWDGATPAALAALLVSRGLDGSRLTVLEAMGGQRERVRSVTAAAFDLGDTNPLNTIAVEVTAQPGGVVLPVAAGLDDALFESDGQLTRRDVRAVTIGALEPQPGQLLWDIGLGAGSVAIEWLLRHTSLKAIGVEERADRADRARRNAVRLGAPELSIVTGQAPAALEGLQAPDAVFIGGGISEAGVFEAAWQALKPGGRLVANVVSLEGEVRLAALHRVHGGEMVRIALSRLEAVGTMHGWRPAMAVTQWRTRKL